jgi:hypothetical protein
MEAVAIEPEENEGARKEGVREFKILDVGKL